MNVQQAPKNCPLTQSHSHTRTVMYVWPFPWRNQKHLNIWLLSVAATFLTSKIYDRKQFLIAVVVFNCCVLLQVEKQFETWESSHHIHMPELTVPMLCSKFLVSTVYRYHRYQSSTTETEKEPCHEHTCVCVTNSTQQMCVK